MVTAEVKSCSRKAEDRRRSLNEPSNQAWALKSTYYGACTASLHSLLHSQLPQGKTFFVFPLRFSFQHTPDVSHPSTMLCADHPGSQ